MTRKLLQLRTTSPEKLPELTSSERKMGEEDHRRFVLNRTATAKAATAAEKASAAAARDSFERREKLRLEASEWRIKNPRLGRPHKK
jgi:uncharacterized protein with WD repeat